MAGVKARRVHLCRVALLKRLYFLTFKLSLHTHSTIFYHHNLREILSIFGCYEAISKVRLYYSAL